MKRKRRLFAIGLTVLFMVAGTAAKADDRPEDWPRVLPWRHNHPTMGPLQKDTAVRNDRRSPALGKIMTARRLAQGIRGKVPWMWMLSRALAPGQISSEDAWNKARPVSPNFGYDVELEGGTLRPRNWAHPRTNLIELSQGPLAPYDPDLPDGGAVSWTVGVSEAADQSKFLPDGDPHGPPPAELVHGESPFWADVAIEDGQIIVEKWLDTDKSIPDLFTASDSFTLPEKARGDYEIIDETRGDYEIIDETRGDYEIIEFVDTGRSWADVAIEDGQIIVAKWLDADRSIPDLFTASDSFTLPEKARGDYEIIDETRGDYEIIDK